MKKQNRLLRIESQIRRLEKARALLRVESSRFSRRRLFTFLGGLIVGIAAYYMIAHRAGWSVMATAFVIFNVLAFYHRKVTRSIEKHTIWLELKTRQAARMRLDWQNIPAPALAEVDEHHPFEHDLDVTGRFSLFQLLDTTISRAGSALLREWLTEAEPAVEQIRERQKLVKELAPLVRFRDKLYLAFRLVSSEPLDGKLLLRFLQQQEAPAALIRTLVISSVLAAVTIVLFLLNQFGFMPPFWGYSLLIYVVIYFMSQRFIEHLLDETDFISGEIGKLRAVLKFLESYPYKPESRLREMCKPFWQTGQRPSQQLRLITLVSAAIGIRMNPLFRIVLNVAVPYDFFMAWLMGKLKVRLARHVETWLDVLVQLEPVSALANFAWLNPSTVFPEIKADQPTGAAILSVRSLGHPLIPDEQRRCNDFTFQEIGGIALITGSNMSGKSTFLKTVGINVCLAQAGAPVVAQAMQMTPVRLFTCIQIHDSITDGFSFFYAEVKRLRRLLEALQQKKERPLLFLIDEIFRGTNNRERLIGSRSYIQALAGSSGLGAISTHDLELTSLSESIPKLINYHFREEVRDGKMVFDYKMRPGPCPSTNALKIMKLEGLPVEE